MATSFSSLTNGQSIVTPGLSSRGQLDTVGHIVQPAGSQDTLPTEKPTNNYLNIGGPSILQTGNDNTQHIILAKSSQINCTQIGEGEKTQNIIVNLSVAEKKRAAVEIENNPDEDVTIQISIKRKKNGKLENADDIEDAGLNALNNKPGLKIIIEMEDTANMTVEEIRKGSIILRQKDGQSTECLIKLLNEGYLEGVVAQILRQDGVRELVKDEELEVNVEVNLSGSSSQLEHISDVHDTSTHRGNNIFSNNHVRPGLLTQYLLEALVLLLVLYIVSTAESQGHHKLRQLLEEVYSHGSTDTAFNPWYIGNTIVINYGQIQEIASTITRNNMGKHFNILSDVQTKSSKRHAAKIRCSTVRLNPLLASFPEKVLKTSNIQRNVHTQPNNYETDMESQQVVYSTILSDVQTKSSKSHAAIIQYSTVHLNLLVEPCVL